MSDVIVVGGGVIGLLTARKLLQRGAQVTLIEKSQPGEEASWAGGGIVSPLYPWNYAPAISALASWAQDYYPILVEDLLAETGIDAELLPCGLLMLDPPDLEEALAWGRQFGKTVEEIGAAAVAQQEPAANRAWSRALWLPYVSNIRNPRLLQALKASLLQRRGFELVTQSNVEAIRQEEGCLAVRCGGQTLFARQVVVCAGAWTPALLAPFGFELPVVPVRGQMLLFEPRPGLINSIILKDGKYAIPRRDGHILVGSTTEEVGFDKSTTEEARALLLHHAVDIVPALAEVPVVKQWAGLRPGAPGGIPFIGAVPGVDNLFVNAGHYRNGLVLAPASAQLMADLVSGKKPVLNPAPYDPARTSEALEMV